MIGAEHVLRPFRYADNMRERYGKQDRPKRVRWLHEACSNDEKNRTDERQAIRIAGTRNFGSRPLLSCSEMRYVPG